MTRDTCVKWIRFGVKWVVALFFGIMLLFWFEHRQVFHPTREFDTNGSELGRPMEEVFFSTDDGVRLHAWFFPLDAENVTANPVILLCHGNAGNISHRLEQVSALLSAGASVFLFDYRGYGRSEGRPGEAGTYRDAHAAWGWLREKGFAAERIVALGVSLGGGVASELAASKPVGGLVLVTTFTSVTDLGAELFPWLPVRWLGRIKYDTRARLPEIRVPVLICHSRADDLVPFHHAERNYAVANEPKRFCEIEGGHNDFLYVDREGYRRGVAEFLQSLSTDSRSE